MAQEFLYGCARVDVDGEILGYIEEDSFDLGGSPGETTDVKASQVPGAPVLSIPKSNGTIKPTFDLIQIKYKVMEQIMGGTAIPKEGSDTEFSGWKAPSKLVQVQKPVIIYSYSGHKITILKGNIQVNLGDKLTLSGVAKLKTTVSPMTVNATTEPYRIEDYDLEDLDVSEG
ncbi:MAG: hypothetical protein LBH32_01345 [Dysgonamonadaceae bacterium]|jgi:hypothetical protein|nr:hypothetical protein [Dysgonamonadaceae bacterium]